MPPKRTRSSASLPPNKKSKRDTPRHVDGSKDDDAAAASVASTPPPPPMLSLPVPSVRGEPLVSSYSWHSDVPIACVAEVSNADEERSDGNERPGKDETERTPCVLGIDEAGRGPVLGPMVYAVAYCPISFQDQLKDLGFTDSKALTAERRSELLQKLCSDPERLGWGVRVLSPQDISAGMLRRHPYNLNAQAHDATIGLIRDVLDRGVNVTEIYVDTVGNPATYQRQLESFFPRHIRFLVTSKADALFPVVGAASIAAKVTRDEIVEGWKWVRGEGGVPSWVWWEAKDEGEQRREGERCGDDADAVAVAQKRQRASVKLTRGGEAVDAITDCDDKEKDDDTVDTGDGGDGLERCGRLGSGYPGDPDTHAYLRAHLDPVFGFHPIVRFSWATAKTLMEEKGVAVRWTDEPVKISRYFLNRSPSSAPGASVSSASSEASKKGRPALLKDLGLVSVGEL